jgi:hypothetical protein
MSDSRSQEKMSRRDWFRLRKSPSQPSPQQQPSASLKTDKMESVAEPVNHGGVDLSTLPPMHEALLDKKEVAALFSDLEQHAGAVQLIVRGAAGNKPDQSAHLDLACEQLLSGKVRKLQVRYQWQNAKWIDTLEQRPDGFRLVRIQHVA